MCHLENFTISVSWAFQMNSLFTIWKQTDESIPVATHMPLGTARLPTPKCIRNERLFRLKCTVDQNITRQREPGL